MPLALAQAPWEMVTFAFLWQRLHMQYEIM